MYDTIWSCSCVRYNLVLFPCTIQSGCVLVYDINLGATHTTILSTRGVTIPIYLVSSATDSIRRRVVLFKLVPIPTSDPKSEFLCQSSLELCRTYRPPLHPSYAWDISHALVIMYHPYCHSPGALTEYLKQKLHHQRAKRPGRSLPAQVKQNIPLKRNRTGAPSTKHEPGRKRQSNPRRIYEGFLKYSDLTAWGRVICMLKCNTVYLARYRSMKIPVSF